MNISKVLVLVLASFLLSCQHDKQDDYERSNDSTDINQDTINKSVISEDTKSDFSVKKEDSEVSDNNNNRVIEIGTNQQIICAPDTLTEPEVFLPDSAIVKINRRGSNSFIVKKDGEGSITSDYPCTELIIKKKLSEVDNRYILEKCGAIVLGKKGIISYKKRTRNDGLVKCVDYLFPYGKIIVYSKGRKYKPVEFVLRIENEYGISTVFNKEFLDLITRTQVILARDIHEGQVKSQSVYDYPTLIY